MGSLTKCPWTLSIIAILVSRNLVSHNIITTDDERFNANRFACHFCHSCLGKKESLMYKTIQESGISFNIPLIRTLYFTSIK